MTHRYRQTTRAMALVAAWALAGCASGTLASHKAAGGAAFAPAMEASPSTPGVGADAHALAHHGTQLAERGDHLRAEQYIKLAVNAGYPEREAIDALLAACIGAGRMRSALLHAEPYLARNPTDVRVRYVAAILLEALGEPKRALAQLELVVRDAPQAAHAHFHIGRLLSARGPTDGDGEQSLRRYLALAPSGEHASAARALLASADSRGASAPERGTRRIGHSNSASGRSTSARGAL